MTFLPFSFVKDKSHGIGKRNEAVLDRGAAKPKEQNPPFYENARGNFEMTIHEALYELGIRDDTLTAEEKNALDTQGFLTLTGILTESQVQAIAARTDFLVQSEGEKAGAELGQQELGVKRLSNLVDKGELFDVFYTHPKVLAGIAHVLSGDMKLSSLNFRSSLPDFGLQGMHTDGGDPVAHGDYYVCNSIWLLDDFTEENGATRLVAGSNRYTVRPHDEMPDTTKPHPQETLLIAPRGSVAIFNSHTWHGGTLNRSTAPRRALHSYWTRRGLPQQLDMERWLSAETKARMSPPVKVILGIDE